MNTRLEQIANKLSSDLNELIKAVAHCVDMVDSLDRRLAAIERTRNVSNT